MATDPGQTLDRPRIDLIFVLAPHLMSSRPWWSLPWWSLSWWSLPWWLLPWWSFSWWPLPSSQATKYRMFKSKSFMCYSKFRNCLFPRSQKVPKISFTRICLSIFHVRPLKMLSQGWRNKGCKLQRVHVYTQFFGRETKDHLRCSLQFQQLAPSLLSSRKALPIRIQSCHDSSDVTKMLLGSITIP